MIPNTIPGKDSGHHRGSVVIFVLGIILLTAFLLTKLMDRAAVELAAESRAARRGELRQEAFAALEASLAVLADQAAVDNGLHDPRDGWGRPLERMDYRPTDGVVAEVTVSDETGKLSLPLADEEKLTAYLGAIGCPVTATDRLVDPLLAWTRPDHISLEGDTLEFAATPLPYAAPQRALRSFDELRAIPAARELFFDEQGRWSELGLLFRAGASLYAFNATNVNTAGAGALVAHGLDPASIGALDSARLGQTRNGSIRSTAALAGVWGSGGTPPGIGAEALCLQVQVMARRGGISYRLDAWVGRPGAVAVVAAQSPMVVDPADGANRAVAVAVRGSPRNKFDYPFLILELRENAVP